MTVILQLGGWERYIEVDSGAMCRGHIEATIEPPLDILAKPGAKVPKDSGGVIVSFTHYGTFRGNVPVFKNKP